MGKVTVATLFGYSPNGFPGSFARDCFSVSEEITAVQYKIHALQRYVEVLEKKRASLATEPQPMVRPSPAKPLGSFATRSLIIEPKNERSARVAAHDWVLDRQKKDWSPSNDEAYKELTRSLQQVKNG